MSNLFFSSDLHFFHKNIIQYSNRPYSSVEEMNEALIKNWNDNVKPNDTIWTLGDFSFGNYQLTTGVLSRLNGNHHMVYGNHDQTIMANYKTLLDSGLVQSIQYYKELKHDDQLIILFHYGMRVWRSSHHGSILLYGHSHGSLPPFGKSVDVGVDCKEITPEYRPVSIDEVLAYMKNRQGQVVDHHGKNKR